MTDAPAEAAPSFEEAQKELERIVDRLERGEVALDEAISLWQRGEELYRFCAAKLEGAQGEIEELARRSVDERAPSSSDE